MDLLAIAPFLIEGGQQTLPFQTPSTFWLLSATVKVSVVPKVALTLRYLALLFWINQSRLLKPFWVLLATWCCCSASGSCFKAAWCLAHILPLSFGRYSPSTPKQLPLLCLFAQLSSPPSPPDSASPGSSSSSW